MRTNYLLSIGAVAALFLAAPLSAQRGAREVGIRGGGEAVASRGGVERVLRLRDRLELSEDQISALNTLREERLALRGTAVETQMKLRSEVAAGEMTRAEMREALKTHRESMGEVTRAGRDELGEILTEEQTQQLRAQNRRVRNGRSGARGIGPRARPTRRAPGLRTRTPRGQDRFQRGGDAPFRRGFAPRSGRRGPSI